MPINQDACSAAGVSTDPVYRTSSLYPCVARHYDELEAGGHFTCPVEEHVLTRFLDCGDLPCIFLDMLFS